jgi:hypothetical protein
MAGNIADTIFKPNENYVTKLSLYGEFAPGNGPTRENQGIRLKVIPDESRGFKFDVAIPQMIPFMNGPGVEKCHGVVEGVYDIGQVVVKSSSREAAILQENEGKKNSDLVIFLKNRLFRSRSTTVQSPDGDAFPPPGTYDVKMNCTASFATYIKNSEAVDHLGDFCEAYKQVYERFYGIAKEQRGATEEELWRNLYTVCINDNFKGAVPDEFSDYDSDDLKVEGKKWKNSVAWLRQLSRFYYLAGGLSSHRDITKGDQPAQHDVSGYNLYWAGDKEHNFETVKVPANTIVYEPYKDGYEPLSAKEVVSQQKMSGVFVERELPVPPK